MGEASKAKFRETLTKHYTELFNTNHPDYLFSKALNSPEVLADKMTSHLYNGTANKDGEGIKRTCKELGIKHTYKAIQAYLNGE